MATNPALNSNIFNREIQASRAGAFTPGWGAPTPGQAPPSGSPVAQAVPTMRMGGTASATAILLGILIVAGWFGWQAVTVTVTGIRSDGTEITSVDMPSWLWISWVVGLGIAILTIFKPKLARITGPLYAIAEGFLVGAISKITEIRFDGIVLQAVGLTMGVFVLMLALFATGAIKVTDKFRIAVIVSTGAIALVYLVSMFVQWMGGSIPMIHDAGPIGIGFSLLVVGIASMNLLLDFDFVQRGVAAQAPRYMEWFAAFGLLITLVWLYLEILRLLSKLRSR